MKTYFGVLNFQDNVLDLNLFNGQNDEEQFIVTIDATISLNLTIAAGVVTGNATASDSVSAIAVNDSDHDEADDSFSHSGSNTTSVGGSLTGGVDILWQFDNGSLEFLGQFDSTQTVLAGNLIVYDAKFHEGTGGEIDFKITLFDLTTPAQTTYQAMYGVAASATELNVLIQFGAAQSTYAEQIQVADVSLYVYQALGLALSGGPAFQNKYAPTALASDGTFSTQAYLDVFHHAGTPAQVQHFVDQVDFFISIYTASGAYGADASHIDLLACAATYGQMLGVAAENQTAVFPDAAGANAALPATPLVGISSSPDPTMDFLS
jgi:hypothetical protein